MSNIQADNILSTNAAQNRVTLSICQTTFPLSQPDTHVMSGHNILKCVEILVAFFSNLECLITDYSHYTIIIVNITQ